MDVMNSYGENSRDDLVDWLDRNMNLSAEEIKVEIAGNQASRQLLGTLTNIKSIVRDFEENDRLITEEVTEDE